jgi:hypothetical protein
MKEKSGRETRWQRESPFETEDKGLLSPEFGFRSRRVGRWEGGLEGFAELREVVEDREVVVESNSVASWVVQPVQR